MDPESVKEENQVQPKYDRINRSKVTPIADLAKDIERMEQNQIERENINRQRRWLLIQIKDFLKKNPVATREEVVKKYKLSPNTVDRIFKYYK